MHQTFKIVDHIFKKYRFTERREREREGGRERGRQAGRQASRQAGRQADRQTDKQTHLRNLTPRVRRTSEELPPAAVSDTITMPLTAMFASNRVSVAST
jgi:hypothetical protein